jgi:hypothetical protein
VLGLMCTLQMHIIRKGEYLSSAHVFHDILVLARSSIDQALLISRQRVGRDDVTVTWPWLDLNSCQQVMSDQQMRRCSHMRVRARNQTLARRQADLPPK